MIIDRALFQQGLLGHLAPSGGQGRDGQAHHILDQQLCPQARADRPVVPPALAGRAFLQMDQAASAHQGFPGHQRERREDADLGCSVHQRTDCHHQKNVCICRIASTKSFKS